MNYNQLVVSKNPTVYVPFDNGSDIATIGETTQRYLTHLHPVYYGNAIKRAGFGSMKVGHGGTTLYDYAFYNDPAVSTWQSSKTYYAHIEFWAYYTDQWVSGSHAIGSMYYQNTSPQYTYTSLGGSTINVSRQINFSTNTAINSEPHTLTSTGTVPIGQWVHIAMQYDYGIKRIYINGVLDVEQNTGLIGGLPPCFGRPGGTSRITSYYDEFALWLGNTTTRPANFPTAADILERATFPTTKTRWWNATAGAWQDSSDELYWNGTEWISMQDMPYKYWNGTEWVSL
jgi:hypothetical protein